MFATKATEGNLQRSNRVLIQLQLTPSVFLYIFDVFRHSSTTCSLFLIYFGLLGITFGTTGLRGPYLVKLINVFPTHTYLLVQRPP